MEDHAVEHEGEDTDHGEHGNEDGDDEFELFRNASELCHVGLNEGDFVYDKSGHVEHHGDSVDTPAKVSVDRGLVGIFEGNDELELGVDDRGEGGEADQGLDSLEVVQRCAEIVRCRSGHLDVCGNAQFG